MSRPTTDDPTKYEHALREYQLATRNFALGTGVKKIDDFAYNTVNIETGNIERDLTRFVLVNHIEILHDIKESFY